MDLPTFIQHTGNAAAAHLFGVSEGTAKAWRYGYRKPSSDAARRIIERTGGKVGWNEIYPPTTDARASNGSESS